MTTITIEQFREQCARACEETEVFFDINVWMNSTKQEMSALTAHELARLIRALPLPVMPEQAEPEGLTDEWLQEMMSRNIMICGHKTENEFLRSFAFRVLHAFGSSEGAHKAFTHWYESDNKKQYDELKKATVAANARVAELEAENAKLKKLSATDELLQIGKLLRTQDNRCTDQPVFEVQRKRSRITEEGYGEYRVEWRDTEADYSIASELRSERLETLYHGGGDVPDRYQRNAFEDYWEHVTSCFTKQGCEDHIAANGHNLGETRIYANGSYRNFEYRIIRNWLMSLPEPVSKPE